MIVLRPAMFSRTRPCTLSTSSKFESRSVRLVLAGIVRFFVGYPSRIMASLYIAEDAAAVCPHPRGQVAVAGLLPCGGMGGSEGDRKSTRLNSSHANISYAVFCLKKKTI